jgi:hypothetical protein
MKGQAFGNRWQEKKAAALIYDHWRPKAVTESALQDNVYWSAQASANLRAKIGVFMPSLLRNVFCFTSLASIALLAPAFAETAPPVTLNVHLLQVKAKSSPTLYGLMTEEINYSYDGGLYAELIRNRTSGAVSGRQRKHGRKPASCATAAEA